jgi:gliding motility-associated-like protein
MMKMDYSGCYDEQEELKILSMDSIFINKTLSNDAQALDGMDQLLPQIQTIKYTVYDRWGKLLCQTRGVLPKWNGFNMSKKLPCQTGVYEWKLNFNDLMGGSHDIVGCVKVINTL